MPCRARISSFRSVVKDQCPFRGNPNGFGLGRVADSVPLSAGDHMPPHKQSAKQGVESNILVPCRIADRDFSLYFQAWKNIFTFFSLWKKVALGMPASFHVLWLK